MCYLCDDNWTGVPIDLKTKQKPFFQGMAMFLHVVFKRPDKWTAVIKTIATPSGQADPFLEMEIEINYCPMCGRRLSLGDAGRRNNGNPSEM